MPWSSVCPLKYISKHLDACSWSTRGYNHVNCTPLVYSVKVDTTSRGKWLECLMPVQNRVVNLISSLPFDDESLPDMIKNYKHHNVIQSQTLQWPVSWGNLFWIIMPLVNLFFPSLVILHDICNYGPLKTTFCESQHNCIDIFDLLSPKCHLDSALKSCLYTHYMLRPFSATIVVLRSPPCVFYCLLLYPMRMRTVWLLAIIRRLQ